MDVEIALFVFGLMILFLLELKADLFLFVFGITTYFFLLIFMFSTDPFSIMLSLLNYFVTNPFLGIIIIVAPIIIYELYIKIKDLREKNKEIELNIV